jgi:quinohemoprotein ethanol dehydrogenase
MQKFGGRIAMKLRTGALLAFGLLTLAGCEKAVPPAAVNADRLIQWSREPENWMTYGLSYQEQRHSPLDNINASNIDKLGLAWYFDLDTNRGQEATPLVIDGTLYTTGAWSMVYAFDASTGKLKWSYDPKVDRSRGQQGCCDVVNRGVAAWNGKIYVGAFDGRLVALDAATGKEVWSVVTVDQTKPYTVTGAPRVVKGMVLIGNGGAEFGVRGYVTAYSAETGKQVWRFYTVPGNPADGFENPAMQKAAESWHGEWWKGGGGGTVWDSIVYDPDLDLVYIGVGNGSPWNHQVRSQGKGDNLFVSSIVALRADTGQYVWHYQTTPGDSWDFTATQHIMLADLKIDGRDRKVLMQAPKNGFFYVIDRENGDLISAKNFVPTSWASSIDLKTGRPVENPAARFIKDRALVSPSAIGGHNWHPMAFNPTTGLVYIPAMDVPGLFGNESAGFTRREGSWNTAVDFAAMMDLPDDKAARAATRAA